MKHTWLRLFVDGKWTGPADRMIQVNGISEPVNMDEYAKQHGISLPDSKKQKKKQDEINSYADMEQQDSSGRSEVHGTGDSESTE